MRRDRRPFVPGPGGRRSAAVARARSYALRFGEGNRFVGDDWARRISLREIADGRISVALFAKNFRLSRTLRGEPPGLPKHLSEIQTARSSWDGRVHLDRSRAGRKIARRSDVHSRIE